LRVRSRIGGSRRLSVGVEGAGGTARAPAPTTTFVNERDGVWQLLPSEDLVFIKTSNTPNGHVEIHIASRASNYQTRIVEIPTTFSNKSDGTWSLLFS
jgi:hypothetical protein